MAANSSGLPLLDVEMTPAKRSMVGGGAGDNAEDRIEEMDEISLGDSVTGSVYNSCSVEVKGGGGRVKGAVVIPFKSMLEETDEGSSGKNVNHPGSTWSLTKFFRNTFPICCKNSKEEDDGNNAHGMGTTVCTIFEETNLKLDGVGMKINGGRERSMSGNSSNPDLFSPEGHPHVGSICIIDCNENAQAIQTFKRFWKATGTLVVKNSPFSSAMDVLNDPQPSIFQNVKHLHFENCDLSIEDLCGMLRKLLLLEELRIRTSTSVKADSKMFRAHLMKELKDSREDGEYFVKIGNRFRNWDHPQRLRALSISMPMTWQCDLIYKAVEAVMNDARLEVLIIQSSLLDMLDFLVCPENKMKFENEEAWEHLLTLDCCRALRRSRFSLKELHLSCGNRFPLEHLKTPSIFGAPIDDIFQWSFYCAAGILNVLQEVTSTAAAPDSSNATSDIFPLLSTLNLDLPLIPVRASRTDFLQTPLNTLIQFAARNNHIPRVTVCGLRPEAGLENWMKQNLVNVSKNGMKIGCTYRSTTLAKNLATYDDELVSLAFTIDPEEKRKRVSEIIEPNNSNRNEVQITNPNPTWRYAGVKCLHIINQLPDLTSFSMKYITLKFNHLTKLAIEDHTVRYDGSGKIVKENGSGDCGAVGPLHRSLTDYDIQELFKNFTSLQHLHLDCDMTPITDYGLTGIGESLWTRLTQRNKLYSFWYLPGLKYLFLRGLGVKVTDKSAVYAFSEEYSLRNLTELHVFAPGITNFGKEKIRNAFAGRTGFILEL